MVKNPLVRITLNLTHGKYVYVNPSEVSSVHTGPAYFETTINMKGGEKFIAHARPHEIIAVLYEDKKDDN